MKSISSLVSRLERRIVVVFIGWFVPFLVRRIFVAGGGREIASVGALFKIFIFLIQVTGCPAITAAVGSSLRIKKEGRDVRLGSEREGS